MARRRRLDVLDDAGEDVFVARVNPVRIAYVRKVCAGGGSVEDVSDLACVGIYNHRSRARRPVAQDDVAAGENALAAHLYAYRAGSHLY